MENTKNKLKTKNYLPLTFLEEIGKCETAVQVMTFLAIKSYCGKGGAGVCFASSRELAKRAFCGHSTVIRAMQDLKNKKLIKSAGTHQRRVGGKAVEHLILVVPERYNRGSEETPQRRLGEASCTATKQPVVPERVSVVPEREANAPFALPVQPAEVTKYKGKGKGKGETPNLPKKDNSNKEEIAKRIVKHFNTLFAKDYKNDPTLLNIIVKTLERHKEKDIQKAFRNLKALKESKHAYWGTPKDLEFLFSKGGKYINELSNKDLPAPKKKLTLKEKLKLGVPLTSSDLEEGDND